MGDSTLLVVCDEGGQGDIEAWLWPATGATVEVVTRIDALVPELCFEAIDCVLVAPTVDGMAGGNVARGVRNLFPSLPVVVAGMDEDNATELEVTAAGTALGDQAVGDAVREALDADVETSAARPPSRLETLALSMFDGFPNHLYAKDDDARHVLTSDESIELADAIGLTDFEVETGPDGKHAERAVRDDRRVIDHGGSVIEVEEYMDEDDEYAMTTKVPWYSEDREVIGLVGISRDISRRKDHEQELRQQNERLAKVALVAAHELRNELQVATGRLDLMGDDPEQAEVVENSLDRLVSIVDDVVALATQERRVIDRTEVWISTPAHEVWQSLDASPATLDVVDDRRIVADLEAVRLLFDILLSNAVEHGGHDVTVTIGGTDEGFYIADDGSGIEATPPARVFEPGFASNDDMPGFGLYVAQRIATDHDWSLDVTNRPEGGARFDVRGVGGPE